MGLEAFLLVVVFFAGENGPSFVYKRRAPLPYFSSSLLMLKYIYTQETLLIRI
jgi:hypothetical protein